MNDLPTDAIEECIGFYASQDTKRPDDDLAKAQLSALLNENADLARTVRALESVLTENKFNI